jgi:hypothetical protein
MSIDNSKNNKQPGTPMGGMGGKQQQPNMNPNKYNPNQPNQGAAKDNTWGGSNTNRPGQPNQGNKGNFGGDKDKGGKR